MTPVRCGWFHHWARPWICHDQHAGRGKPQADVPSEPSPGGGPAAGIGKVIHIYPHFPHPGRGRLTRWAGR